MSVVPQPDERPTLTVEEAGALLGISRSTAYLEAQRYLDTGGADGIPVLTLGRRRLVPTAEFRRLLRLDPPLPIEHPHRREEAGPQAGQPVVIPITGSATSKGSPPS